MPARAEIFVTNYTNFDEWDRIFVLNSIEFVQFVSEGSDG